LWFEYEYQEKYKDSEGVKIYRMLDNSGLHPVCDGFYPHDAFAFVDSYLSWKSEILKYFGERLKKMPFEGLLFDHAGVVGWLGLYYPPVAPRVNHSKHLRCFYSMPLSCRPAYRRQERSEVSKM
jgi:hypothetical protein